LLLADFDKFCVNETSISMVFGSGCGWVILGIGVMVLPDTVYWVYVPGEKRNAKVTPGGAE
jgi:hypothetical protein